MARITRLRPCRDSCRRRISRKGRPPTVAITLGAFPVMVLNREPAPPHSTIASGVLGIYRLPFTSKRLVVHFFRLIDHDVTSLAREGERNAQQLFQPLPQGLPPLRRNEEQHKAATASAQKLASQSAGTEPGLVDLINACIRDLLCQRSLYLPALVQQAAELI